MKKITLAFLITATSLFGIGLGNYQITPEIGANLSYQNGKNKFTYGGYARVWMGVSRVVIAPQFKYDVIAKSSKNANDSYKNMQIGGLIGFEIPILPLTPYIGVSYSTFENVAFRDTASFNYGIKIDVPLIPFLTIGLDGTYQKPKIFGGGRYEMNRIGATIGLAF
ncbi:hypothetical protein BKH41_07185 [Helicobacter sp. 12S02232-10]|uniref:hypothetical protein n=1 Tax=Helicobacter sp. 12S02232-10 TaxID=1476197 RepID=UPI000BA4F835|nr:hypothetical protein [Helicobacter sp. 12S02232-10]PAF47666.1 hypothetical protein BKH41_07185 [Helicobacter sp. 12S02232-10]